jgi:hypothetical protein
MADPADGTKFRSRLVPSFLYYTVFSQLGYLAFSVPMSLAITLTVPHSWWVWWAVLAGCGGCGLLSLVITPLAVWGYPVYVYPDRLTAYNFWGVYSSPAWDGITAARTLNLGVVSLVRVYTEETWLTLWVPLFLDDLDRFTELVRDFAGDGNPLSAELARHAAGEDEL